MKIRTILGASILLLVSGQVNAALINFDDLSAGTFLTDQYASNGIIFDGTWIHDGLSPPRGSVPNWISGEEVTNNNSNPSAISGYFVNPSNLSQNAITDYFEILSAYVDSDTTVTLEVFDLDGLSLGSRPRTGSSGILSLSVTNIHSFPLSHINSGWNGIDDVIGFDNIVFNDVSLPDPEPQTPSQSRQPSGYSAQH